MKNLTLSVEEHTLDRARDAARKRGKSLNTLVREFLDELAGTRQRSRAVEQLQRLWAQKAGRSGGRKLTRDDAYEGQGVKERVFLDTNVLLYADDEDAGKKRDRARRVIADALRDGSGVVSTQVLQEYFVNATRKLKLDPSTARARIDIYLTFEVIAVRVEHILGAIDLHRLRGLSFWDALVAKCAIDSGCRRLLTEDLQAGSKLDGVLVENPFT